MAKYIYFLDIFINICVSFLVVFDNFVDKLANLYYGTHKKLKTNSHFIFDTFPMNHRTKVLLIGFSETTSDRKTPTCAAGQGMDNKIATFIFFLFPRFSLFLCHFAFWWIKFWHSLWDAVHLDIDYLCWLQIKSTNRKAYRNSTFSPWPLFDKIFDLWHFWTHTKFEFAWP